MSQNQGPISRLLSQSMKDITSGKAKATPKMTPTAADHLLGRVTPPTPQQPPNPIRDQQRANTRAVQGIVPQARLANQGMASGAERKAANEARRANTPGTVENTRELVRRQVTQLPIPQEYRAQVESLIDSALHIRTTYLDPATGLRRRVDPLASGQAIRETGMLDPQDAMEVVELLKTEEGLKQLQAEVRNYRDQRVMGSRRARGVEQNTVGTNNLTSAEQTEILAAQDAALKAGVTLDQFLRTPAGAAMDLPNLRRLVGRGENIGLLGQVQAEGKSLEDPTFAGLGAVIDRAAEADPRIAGARQFLRQNPDALTQGVEGLERASGMLGLGGPAVAATRGILSVVGLDTDSYFKALDQFNVAGARGAVEGMSAMVRIPQLLGSQTFADLANLADAAVAARDKQKPLDDTFFTEMGRVIGGVIPQIAPALLTGGGSAGASAAARMAASVAFAVTEAGANAAGGYNTALRQGENPMAARRRVAQSLPADIIWSAVLNRLGEFGEIGEAFAKAGRKSFADALKAGAVRYGSASALEGIQEGGQTTLENYIATGEIDPTRPEVLKSILLGAAVGGAMKGGLDLAPQQAQGAEVVPQRSAAASAPPVAESYQAREKEYQVWEARLEELEALLERASGDTMLPNGMPNPMSKAAIQRMISEHRKSRPAFFVIGESQPSAKPKPRTEPAQMPTREQLAAMNVGAEAGQVGDINALRQLQSEIDEWAAYRRSLGLESDPAQQVAPQPVQSAQPTTTPAQGTRATGADATIQTNFQDPQARAKAISESPIPGATEAAWSSGNEKIVVGVERIQEAVNRVGSTSTPKDKDVARLLTTMHQVRARAEAAGVDIDPSGELQGIEAQMRDLGYEVDPEFMAAGDAYDTNFKFDVLDHIQAEGELRVHQQLKPGVRRDGRFISPPQIITIGYSEDWQSPEDDGGNAAQLPSPPDGTLPPTATTPDFPRTAPADMPRQTEPQQTAQAERPDGALQKEPWQMTRAEYARAHPTDSPAPHRGQGASFGKYQNIAGKRVRPLILPGYDGPPLAVREVTRSRVKEIDVVFAASGDVFETIRPVNGGDMSAGEVFERIRPALAKIISRYGARPDHWGELTKALNRGLPVPPEVLADYPDLAAKYAPQPAQPSRLGQLLAESQLPAPRTEAAGSQPGRSLPPALAMRLVEAHRAMGRDVTDVQARKLLADKKEELRKGTSADPTERPKIRPKYAETLRQQIARLQQDLALWDEAFPQPPRTEARDSGDPKTFWADVAAKAQAQAKDNPVVVRTNTKQTSYSRPDSIRAKADGTGIQVREGQKWVNLTLGQEELIARQVGLTPPPGLSEYVSGIRAKQREAASARDDERRAKAEAERIGKLKTLRDRLSAIVASGVDERGKKVSPSMLRDLQDGIAKLTAEIGDNAKPTAPAEKPKESGTVQAGSRPAPKSSVERYFEAKQSAPDGLLAIRVGDFYEFYGDDAEKAAEALGITVTGRDTPLRGRVPMSGVPFHAVERYATRLAEAGYDLSIVDEDIEGGKPTRVPTIEEAQLPRTEARTEKAPAATGPETDGNKAINDWLDSATPEQLRALQEADNISKFVEKAGELPPDVAVEFPKLASLAAARGLNGGAVKVRAYTKSQLTAFKKRVQSDDGRGNRWWSNNHIALRGVDLPTNRPLNEVSISRVLENATKKAKPVTVVATVEHYGDRKRSRSAGAYTVLSNGGRVDAKYFAMLEALKPDSYVMNDPAGVLVAMKGKEPIGVVGAMAPDEEVNRIAERVAKESPAQPAPAEKAPAPQEPQLAQPAQQKPGLPEGVVEVQTPNGVRYVKTTEGRTLRGAWRWKTPEEAAGDTLLTPHTLFKPNPSVKDLPHQRFWEFTGHEIEDYRVPAREEQRKYDRGFAEADGEAEEYFAKRFPNLRAYLNALGDLSHNKYLEQMLDQGKAVPDRVLAFESANLDDRVARRMTPDKARRQDLVDEQERERFRPHAEQMRSLAAKFRAAIKDQGAAKEAAPQVPAQEAPTQPRAEVQGPVRFPLSNARAVASGGAVTIYPRGVGKVFSEDDLDAIDAWGKQSGLLITSLTPTRVKVFPRAGRDQSVVDSVRERWPKTKAQIKAEEEARQYEARKAAVKQSDEATLAKHKDIVAWFDGVFGDGIGPHNKASMVRYLAGETDSFNGLMSRSWVPGLLSLGVPNDNTWKESKLAKFVKSAYEASAQPAQQRPTQETQAPDILASPTKPAKKDTITVDGKERPRLNSNGKPIHPTDEGIINFWRWFGDSKVVDEQGRPLVVYHGTAKAFTQVNFKKGAQGLFWFSSSQDAITSGVAAAKATDTLMPLYVKSDKPATWAQYKSLTMHELKRSGFDGAVLEHDGYIDGFVFASPTQVKSATGNQGTFSSSNPSILASPTKPRPGAAPAPMVPPAPKPNGGAVPLDLQVDPLASAPGARAISIPEIERAIDDVYGRTHRGTSAKGTDGSYSVSSGARWVRDGKFLVGIHEAGHQTSYQAQVIPHFTGPAMDELRSGYFDGTIPDIASQDTADQERFAEFFLAWHINPKLAGKVAPTLRKEFEAIMDAHDRALFGKMKNLSGLIRAYQGQNDVQLAAANFIPAESQSLPSKIAKALKSGTWEKVKDNLGLRLTDEYYPVLAAIDRIVGTSLRKGRELLGSKNPETWIRFIPYTSELLNDGLINGMVDWGVSFRTGKLTRSTGSIKDLFAPLKPKSPEFMSNYTTALGYIAALRQVHYDERLKMDAAEQVAEMQPKAARKLADRIALAHAQIDRDLQIDLTNLAVQGKATKAATKTLIDAADARKDRATKALTARSKAGLTRYRNMVLREAAATAARSGIVAPGANGRTATDIARGALASIASDPETKAMVEAFAAEIRRHGDWQLSMMEHSGRLSMEQAERIRQRNPYWFPIDRETSLDEDLDEALGFVAGQKIGNAKNVIREFKGSQKSMSDVVGALVKRNADVLAEFHRNMAARTMVDWVEDRGAIGGKAGVFHRVPTEVGIKPKDTQFFVWRNGEKETWEADPGNTAFVAAIKSFSGPRMEDKWERVFWMIFETPTQVNKAFVTNSLPFMIRNLWRDTVHASIKLGLNPLAVFRPKSDFVNQNYDALAIGLGRSTDIISKSKWERNQAQMIKKASGEEMVILRPYRAAQDLREESERTPRKAVFDREFKKHMATGHTEVESALMAMMYARNGMTDFRQGGTTVRALSRMVMFLNASVQGTRTSLRAYRDDPVRTSLALAKYAGIWLAVEAAWAALGGEDEEKRLEQLDGYQRDMFWNFRIGGDNGWWLTIPKGHDEALGVGIIQRLALRVAGKDASHLQNTRNLARDTVLPMDDASDLFGGWLPSVELGFNRDWRTGKEIVPFYDQGPVHERSGTGYASTLGQALQRAFGNKLDARQWDHLIENSFGYYGRVTTSGSDSLRDGDTDALARAGIRFTGLNLPGRATNNATVLGVENYLRLWSKRPQAWSDAKGAFFDAKTEAERQEAGRKLIALAEKWHDKFESIKDRPKPARELILKTYFEAFKTPKQ